MTYCPNAKNSRNEHAAVSIYLDILAVWAEILSISVKILSKCHQILSTATQILSFPYSSLRKRKTMRGR